VRGAGTVQAERALQHLHCITQAEMNLNLYFKHQGPWTAVNQKRFYENILPDSSAVHKAQGETIPEDFTIFDWERMDTNIRYTALSRAKNHSKYHLVR
jgi:hypothetical protein